MHATRHKKAPGVGDTRGQTRRQRNGTSSPAIVNVTPALREAEKIVAGYLCGERPAIVSGTLGDILRGAPDSFDDLAFGEAVAHARGLYDSGTPPETVGVKDWMDPALLPDLSGFVVEGQANHFAPTVKDGWVKRSMLETFQAGIEETRNPDATVDGILTYMEGAVESIRRIQASNSNRPKPIFLTAAVRTPDDHEDMLFRRRVLKRGETWLVTGPTGIGKSVLTVEASIHWALGRGFFGFEPLRPLSSVIFVAEDDEDEMAWFRDGIFRHLRLSEQEMEEVGARVSFIVCGDLAGADFVSKDLRPTLESIRPDICHLNPALAYIGGEAKDQEVTANFLRGQWQPALRDYNAGGFIAHHNPKQNAQSRKAEKDKFLSDYSYAGFGSVEWSNYPRGILVIEPTSSRGVFRLICPKRGQRLDWTGPDGERTCIRHIRHADDTGTLGWIDARPEDIPKNGRPAVFNPEDLLCLIAKKPLETKAWQQVAEAEYGIKRARFFALKTGLEKAGRIAQSVTSGGWYVVNQAR